eukprot:238653-Prorocentrum_minimum.AAC.1
MGPLVPITARVLSTSQISMVSMYINGVDSNLMGASRPARSLKVELEALRSVAGNIPRPEGSAPPPWGGPNQQKSDAALEAANQELADLRWVTRAPSDRRASLRFAQPSTVGSTRLRTFCSAEHRRIDAPPY